MSDPETDEHVHFPGDDDGYQSYCTGCLKDFTSSQARIGQELADGVPASRRRRRHPESLPFSVKHFKRCQWCLLQRDERTRLFVCSRCKVDEYCSKDCQTSAWPSHKDTCKMNRQAERQSAIALPLQAFTTKHRFNLNRAGRLALGLASDPTRGSRSILVVTVSPRPQSKRDETSFFAHAAQVVPLEFVMKDKTDDFRSLFARCMRNYDRTGIGRGPALGAYCTAVCSADADGVLFTEIQTNVFDASEVEKDDDVPPGAEWKETLIRRLNEGITAAI